MTNALTTYQRVSEYLKSDIIKAAFAEVVGAHEAAAFITSVLIAVRSNDTLMDCTPESIAQSAMRAATLRLSVDPSLGQAALVPYKGRCTFQVMYKGLIQLALKTGKYRYINAAPIYEGMDVEEDVITGWHKVIGRKSSDKITGWIAAFELFTGFAKTLYMTREAIHDHASRYSKSYHDERSPWKTHTREMERKTVLKRLLSQWGVFAPDDKRVLDEIEAEEREETTQLPDEEDTPQPVEKLEDGDIIEAQPVDPQEKETQNETEEAAPEIKVKNLIAELAAKHEGRTITDGKKGLIAPMLEKCFGTGYAEGKRQTEAPAAPADPQPEPVLDLRAAWKSERVSYDTAANTKTSSGIPYTELDADRLPHMRNSIMAKIESNVDMPPLELEELKLKLDVIDAILEAKGA